MYSGSRTTNDGNRFGTWVGPFLVWFRGRNRALGTGTGVPGGAEYGTGSYGLNILRVTELLSGTPWGSTLTLECVPTAGTVLPIRGH